MKVEIKKQWEQLKKLTSITEKLNCAESIRKGFIDDQLDELQPPLADRYYLHVAKADNKKWKVLEDLYGKEFNLVTPLLIPENIYQKHFKEYANTSEFTWWFLQFNAKQCFHNWKMKEYEKLNTPDREVFIEAELNELNAFESKAIELLKSKAIDIFRPSYEQKQNYDKEIEYLRLKNNYYRTRLILDVNGGDNTTVEQFFKHFILKTYLEDAFNIGQLKECTQNNIRIRELSLEDWEKGNISSSMQPGKRLVKNDSTGEEWYDYLSDIEYDKIQEKCKELYWQKVSDGFKRQKESFARRYEKSDDKEQLVKNEINQCNAFLKGWNKPLHNKLIVNGERDYRFTESPNNPVRVGAGDHWHVQTEVLHKFMKWLKSLGGKASLTGNAKLTPSKKNKPQTLKEIWTADSKGTKDQYKKVIEYLKREYSEIGKPFLTEITGELHWTKVPGRIQYLAGFIYQMIKKKWIADKYSAPDYQRILSNTFNIDFKPEPFKSLSANPPNEKYLIPFKDFPENG